MCGLRARKATGEPDETPSMSRLRRAPRLRRRLRLLSGLRPYIVKHRCPGAFVKHRRPGRRCGRQRPAALIVGRGVRGAFVSHRRPGRFCQSSAARAPMRSTSPTGRGSRMPIISQAAASRAPLFVKHRRPGRRCNRGRPAAALPPTGRADPGRAKPTRTRHQPDLARPVDTPTRYGMMASSRARPPLFAARS